MQLQPPLQQARPLHSTQIKAAALAFLILLIRSPSVPICGVVYWKLPYLQKKLILEPSSSTWEQVWLTRQHATQQQFLPMGRSSRCLKGKSNSRESRVEFHTAIIHKLQCCLHCRIVLISAETSYLLHIIKSHILLHLCLVHVQPLDASILQISLIKVPNIKTTLLPSTPCVSHEPEKSYTPRSKLTRPTSQHWLPMRHWLCALHRWEGNTLQNTQQHLNSNWFWQCLLDLCVCLCPSMWACLKTWLHSEQSCLTHDFTTLVPLCLPQTASWIYTVTFLWHRLL